MFNTIILVFLGGAVGAVARELLMLTVPDLADGFPLSIFVANIVASFLLGIASGLFEKGALSQNANLFIATGVMGGLSTFSSFVYGGYVLMTGGANGVSVALTYLIASVIIGAIALYAGARLTGARLSS